MIDYRAIITLGPNIRVSDYAINVHVTRRKRIVDCGQTC